MTSIPGWERKRLGDIATIVGGGTPRREIAEYWNGYIPWATPTDVTKNRSYELSQTTDYITEEALRNSAAKLIPAGSVLMTTRATIGYCVINTLPMATNQGFTNFICSEQILNKFLLHLLTFRREEFESLASGSTFKEISKSTLRSYAIDVPPLPEQRKIAAILTSVDDAIAATQRIIDQTERVKRGLMQQLLTRGIGHTKFKQTEIGEIPEEWDVMSGKEVYEICSGYAPSAINFSHSTEADVCYLKVSDMNLPENRKYVRLTNIMFSKAENENIRSYERGTIVFPKRGAAIFTNKMGILDTKATFDTNIMGLICKQDVVLNEYVYYLLLHVGLYNISDNSGVPQINNKHLYPFKLAIPPMEEQQTIVNILSSFDLKLDNELNYYNQLSSLKQYLMHVLLTGKVRVKVEEEAEAVV